MAESARSDDVEFIVVLTRMEASGGTGRHWQVDEATWEAIASFLPSTPTDSFIFTPEDMALADEFSAGMVVIEGGECDA